MKQISNDLRTHLAAAALALAALATALFILIPLPSDEQWQLSAASCGIPEDVIRLHILADNDTEEAQTVKLLVRDALLPRLHELTAHAASKEEALLLLRTHCGELSQAAQDVLREQGVSYLASVEITSCYFPLRIYGSQTYLSADAVLFPPAVYDTVNVVLGRGEGHNWWCLAYPSLCLIDASYDYLPKESTAYEQVFAELPANRVSFLFHQSCSSFAPETQESTPVVLRFRLLKLLSRLLKKE